MNKQDRPALFLDRDGVINVDHAYVHKRENFDFIDGIFALVRAARARGCRVFVVTNQAGIARGYYGEPEFHALTDWMCARFAAESAPIDRVYFCPDHPEHGIGAYRRDTPMRKPGPGMLLEAAREFAIDLPGSLLVGDMDTDIAAGQAAGVGRLLQLRFPSDERPVHAAAIRIRSLADAEAYLPRASFSA